MCYVLYVMGNVLWIICYGLCITGNVLCVVCSV